MKKYIKFVLFFCFFMILNISSVYAVGIDMNLTNTSTYTNTVTNTVSNTSFNDVSTNYINNDSTTENYSTTQKVSTTSTSDEDFHLTVSDIINIILIAVGVVLILLGIAILIKIK